MKAALCRTLDGPSAITIEDIDEPVAGPGEVVVTVAAAALNFLDTLLCRGRYQFKPDLPFSPAAEVSGVVSQLGEGVTHVVIGQPVCAYTGWGGAREKIVARVDQLIPLPENVSHDIAAGISVTYGTAFHGLKDRGQLAAGETVAILGASGGAGLAAVEVAKRLGARVIAAASSDDRLELCRKHGADELLNYSETDLRDGLKELTRGRGVDVIYDCIGGDFAERALRAIAWQGRFLVIGFAAGQIPRIPLNLALLKGCDIRGVFWGKAVEKDPGRHRDNMLNVLDWIASGTLTPHIHQRFTLRDTGDAISVLDRREAKGKVIIEI